MAHKKALVHRKCGVRLADGTKCRITWGEGEHSHDPHKGHADRLVCEAFDTMSKEVSK